MSLRFLDSFDHYATADLLLKWTSLSSVAAINAGTGRRSTASLRFANSLRYLNKALTSQATWIVGFAMRFTALPSTAVAILELLDNTTSQLDVRLTPTGALAVTRNGTVLGTTAVLMSANVYYYLELLATIHNTAGVVEVRVDGTSRLSLTSQDTQNSSNATADVIRVGMIQNFPIGNLDYDDLYVCDGTGSAPHNTFLGDCRVDSLLPSSDGTSQQWTPSTPGTHYTLVDETAPNTTDYVASSTVGHRDTYGMQDLTAMTGTIYGVQLNLAALKNDAGARSIKPLLLSGASEALGSPAGLSTSQTYTLHVQTTDPATGVAWTESAVNAMQAGAEVA